MSDLVGFLRARLDEDEAVARQADEVGLHVVTWSGLEPGMSEEGDLVHRHIGRWNPARVLREVEAKRRIVETCSDVGRPFASEIAEEVLRLLALPDADHPAFRKEWRP